MNLQNWLDSKVTDSEVADKYSPMSCILPVHSAYQLRYQPASSYSRYYTEDDQDIKAHDSFYSDLIDGSDPRDVLSDPTLKHLNSVTQRYGRHTTRSVLIPPNTNRYHANYLFRQMVDLGFSNSLNYSVLGKDGASMTIPFVTPEFKSAFYEFCKKHT